LLRGASFDVESSLIDLLKQTNRIRNQETIECDPADCSFKGVANRQNGSPGAVIDDGVYRILMFQKSSRFAIISDVMHQDANCMYLSLA
jgi:hypothetical protein